MYFRRVNISKELVYFHPDFNIITLHTQITKNPQNNRFRENRDNKNVTKLSMIYFTTIF